MREKVMSLKFELSGSGAARTLTVRVYHNGDRTGCGFEEPVTLAELERKAKDLTELAARWRVLERALAAREQKARTALARKEGKAR